jgi:hypothetical protein
MNKFYAVAFFYSAQEIGIDADVITEPFIYRNTAVFNNKTDQLNCYANTMCPASQLLEANTEKELKEKIRKLRNNFRNNEWLEKNIYPYL